MLTLHRSATSLLQQTRPWLRALLVVPCLVASLGARSVSAADDAAATLPPVQVLVPGFSVREIPVSLTNLVSIEYAGDGRLIAAGYDARLHVLTDTNGDGLEDHVETFQSVTSDDYPLGLVVRDRDVYVLLKNELVRYRDTDGDGIPELRQVVLSNWDEPELANHALLHHRRVDYGMGLAIGPDGAIYVGMGNAAFDNGYWLDHQGAIGPVGLSHYDRHRARGCVLKFSPDGATHEQLVTGVRYLMCLQFNERGDLFATDQEGATWLPNGNPFDELLHLQPGRHYGFPPRHPQYLNDVVDEPSVYDYEPQHQSLCGFRFNGSAGRAVFGPETWRGDAFLAGYTRGKLYRTQLVRTRAGYVAQTQLFAQLQSLAADVSFAPRGDLVVATHSGAPDWGTGPSGEGHLFRIRYDHPEAPLPVATWHEDPTEVRIALDHAVAWSELPALAQRTQVTGGRYVFAGDRLETIRPGYEVVQKQMESPRRDVPVHSAGVLPDGRTLSLRLAADAKYEREAITLPGLGRTTDAAPALMQQSSIDLAATAHGWSAEWQREPAAATWSGWLPHLDLDVDRALLRGSAWHDELFAQLEHAGTLTLRGQLDLWQMLQPAIQPISQLDYVRASETVTLVIGSKQPHELTTDESVQRDALTAEALQAHPDWIAALGPDVAYVTSLQVTPRADHWLPVTLSLHASDGQPVVREFWWTTDDARPRALPLRRFIAPWAVPSGDASQPAARRSLPVELSGGDAQRGRTLFLSDATKCSKCHQVRGEGASLAPNLSHLIHRDYRSVLRDIREPSATLNPDYLAYTVTLVDGRVLNGTLHRQTAAAVTLADNAGQLVELARRDIEQLTPSRQSIMPQDLLQPLHDSQVRDLLTFLLTEPPSATSQTP